LELSTKLEQINSPNDIKNLSYSELKDLASEIRTEIIETVGANGGHLASNLGVVELTLALHRCFDSPQDAIIWDVSHQSYTHKLLTGRYNNFKTLRTYGGMSGFTKKTESEHDIFNAGHSSTSISSALGLLVGRRMQNHSGKVVAVIGDGALTGGMAFEALSHAGQIAQDLIIILNDNQLSISKNTGSLSRYLTKLTMSASYQSFRYKFDRLIDKIPIFNKSLSKFIFRIKRGLKGVFFTNNLFVDLGYVYFGPFNGHALDDLEKVFTKIKKIKGPVVVHVVTKKGKGYIPAEKDPMTFHGLGAFSVCDGKIAQKKELTFTEVFGKKIVEIAERNESIVAITAAMVKGTGLTEFAQKFPNRFFDVGIAEQHAVTFAGGLSVAGIKPVVAIYSTFMQRAIDQLIHDISIQNVPAIFVLDRSGAVPDDGETHQGIFDISLLRPVPNMVLLAPATAKELENALEWAVSEKSAVVIRYPKTTCPVENSLFSEKFSCGRGIIIPHEVLGYSATLAKEKNLFVCTGGIYPEVEEAAKTLNAEGICTDIYNLRFLKPLDKNYFISLIQDYASIVFVEDGIRIGGIGTYLESLIRRKGLSHKTAVCGFPDSYMPQGKRKDILYEAHLSPSHLVRKMKTLGELND